MASSINVSVDETLKKEATDLFADLGLSVQDAIRIFLRRSVKMKGVPFPMSQMEIANTEIQQYKASKKGLASFNTPEEAIATLDRS